MSAFHFKIPHFFQISSLYIGKHLYLLFINYCTFIYSNQLISAFVINSEAIVLIRFDENDDIFTLASSRKQIPVIAIAYNAYRGM